MPAEAVNCKPTLEGDKHKQIGHEVRDMVSAITNRLANLHNAHKPGSSHDVGAEEDEARIITLAGNNTGSIMRGKLLSEHHKHDQHQVSPDDEVEGSDTYANSNHQAVNSSLMLDASYSSNDPGIHMTWNPVTTDSGGLGVDE